MDGEHQTSKEAEDLQRNTEDKFNEKSNTDKAIFGRKENPKNDDGTS